MLVTQMEAAKYLGLGLLDRAVPQHHVFRLSLEALVLGTLMAVGIVMRLVGPAAAEAAQIVETTEGPADLALEAAALDVEADLRARTQATPIANTGVGRMGRAGRMGVVRFSELDPRTLKRKRDLACLEVSARPRLGAKTATRLSAATLEEVAGAEVGEAAALVVQVPPEATRVTETVDTSARAMVDAG